MICDEDKKPDIVIYYCHGKTEYSSNEGIMLTGV
jgi:hypothetical protein